MDRSILSSPAQNEVEGLRVAGTRAGDSVSLVEHIECVRINPALGCSPGHQLARWRPGLYGAFEASSARWNSCTFSSACSSQRQVSPMPFHTAQVGNACCYLLKGSTFCTARPLPIHVDPFPVSRSHTPPRVFFAYRIFSHAFSQKQITPIPRTTLPASLPRRDMSDSCQLSSR